MVSTVSTTFGVMDGSPTSHPDTSVISHEHDHDGRGWETRYSVLKLAIRNNFKLVIVIK